MKVGILTGGGDAPGLNAVIRAVVRRSVRYGNEVIGVRHGWDGLINNSYVPLDLNAVSGILPRGGTIIGTSRVNPYKVKDGIKKLRENMGTNGIEALICVGGEDTLGTAYKLHNEISLPVIGVPKTIDNDIPCTDYTFGFDTAINIATEAIDRLHTTAESHDRIMVVEVMGRHAGWIALHSGLAGGADCILIPERPFRMDDVAELIKRRHNRGKSFSIVVVAEGAVPQEIGAEVKVSEEVDSFGHVRLGGVGYYVSKKLEELTGFETRTVVLGHLQRGGTPTAFDRVLATRFGVAAADLAFQKSFGKMVVLRGNKICTEELERITEGIKTVDLELYDIASIFFG
jgi:6-phosphofructokinase 1